MPLTSGTPIGAYEVLDAIGAGGMGEVYRARDTKLDREVAIKVLPESFAADADRVARFAREAKALAALNHPNIAAIYGIEESGHTRALVMELVTGEDLSQIMARGPMALTEALPIAKQIADGLEAAHQQGIIHRDLKPANIKVRPDGTVKILDFGLAKAADSADASGINAANSPTLTARATQMGLILGTAAYMSPEQAKGRAVDKRADVWAFGVVLYEMLSGQRAFKGDDVSETLASVLKETPDFTALPRSTPARLTELVGRCLARDLRARQRDMGDVLLELSAIDPNRVDLVPARSATPRSPIVTAAVVSGVLALGVAAGWMLHRIPDASNEASLRFIVATPNDTFARTPLLTPDGRTLVFGGGAHLYRRSLDNFETVAIPGTDGGSAPAISPDGRSLAFFTGRELKRVSLSGGDPTTLAEANGNMPGSCWCGDVILFSKSWVSGFSAVPASGGPMRQVTEPDRSKGERGHWRPQLLPNGKVLFSIMMAGTGVNDSRIAVLDLATGKYRTLFPGTDAVYVRSGHVLYFHGGSWRVVPFDLDGERVTGEPAAVLPDAFGVMPDGGSTGNLLAVSDNGALAYLPGPAIAERELVWIDRSGAVQPLGLPPRAVLQATISPDGRRVAMDHSEGGTSSILVADLARKTVDRLDVKGTNMAPVWDPTGEWLAFISERTGQYDTFIARPDGSGERALLAEEYDEAPKAWSRNGRLIVKQWRPDGTVPTISVDVSTGGSPEMVLAETAAASLMRISSDDKWLVYGAIKSGRREVFVRAFAKDAPSLRVSTDGGEDPVWAPSGRELFFRHEESLMVATFSSAGGRPEVSVPRELLKLPQSTVFFDVDVDGRRFLFGRLTGPEPTLGVRVVLNWMR